MNKKKSKSELAAVSFTGLFDDCLQAQLPDPSVECCIFHKQKSFGDWSDDDSDGECTDCHKVSDSNKPEVQSDLSSS